MDIIADDDCGVDLWHKYKIMDQLDNHLLIFLSQKNNLIWIYPWAIPWELKQGGEIWKSNWLLKLCIIGKLLVWNSNSLKKFPICYP